MALSIFFSTSVKFSRNSLVIIKKFYNLRWLCVSNEQVQLVQNKENDDYVSKIVYNETLIPKRKPKISSKPICLQYLIEEEKTDTNILQDVDDEKSNSDIINFPFEIKKSYLKEPKLDEVVTNIFCSVSNLTPLDNETVSYKDNCNSKYFKSYADTFDNPRIKNLNYEDLENDADTIKFGSCDPKFPVSSVPCGGCGALLHCTNMSLPGFIPKEVFAGKSKKELRSEICQRCHFLREFDVALGVNVSTSEYPKIISQIKEKKAMVILIVDLLDFPCSIWPEIMKLIGEKPVIVVANKVDLLIQEGPDFLNNVKNCLLLEIENSGIHLKNIIHVELISAKTGFGVENLIDKLFNMWKYKGDVFLIGCTNVGKSTLFNTLIHSDYCNVKATHFLEKATISAWPGTTLNLLKFPIMEPRGSWISTRKRRLTEVLSQEKAYKKLMEEEYDHRFKQIPLSGHVGQTFCYFNPHLLPNDIFSYDWSEGNFKSKGIDPKNKSFSNSKWCFDTPGVVSSEQIINFLTTSELLLTVPSSMLIPRNFHLEAGYSLFIGGIARLDYVKGVKPCWFTVYASKELPITITKLEDADLVYKNLLGSVMFRVPSGDSKRLEKWPKLASKQLQVTGKIDNEARADVVLSSAGWISITPSVGFLCTLEAWTPEGRGIYLRDNPVLKKGHTFRGSKINKTPAYNTVMKEVKPTPFSKYPNLNS